MMTALPPPAIRNVPPQGRAGRIDKRAYREQLEKNRLRNRTEKFIRYGDEIEKPFDVLPSAVGFMSDADRFHTDTAGDEQRKKQLRLQAKDHLIISMRKANAQREEERYRRIQEEEKKKELLLQYLQNDSKKKIRNQSSMPYNVINHIHTDGLEGMRLALEDEKLKYHAQMRSNNLYSKMNLNGYDPITGSERPIRPVPTRPLTPPQLKVSTVSPK